jgi:hypothetical protein
MTWRLFSSTFWSSELQLLCCTNEMTSRSPKVSICQVVFDYHISSSSIIFITTFFYRTG